MTMDLQRQEYPAALATLQPDQAIDVLNNRVALIGQVNASIADFLLERRRIEERYAAELRKLAKRPQQDNAAALGVFQMPWQRIIAGTENLAQSHETLASKIETDVETPLKQYASKSREMQSVSTVQGNIASIARDFSRAKEKADKLSAKGSKKAGDATSSADDATREWQSQSPYVFEQLQALDEHRINHLRDVLTQFQTHEADQVERNRANAEYCLNALLNVETADEIKTFAAKIQQSGSTSARRRSSVAASDARPVSSGNVPPMPPPPRNQEQRSKGTPADGKTAPEATPQKSKMGGLKRLGTVMSRRKSTAPPPPQSAEKKKEKTRSMMPFRRGDSSRSFQDLEETGRDLTPITSNTEQATPRRGLTSSSSSHADRDVAAISPSAATNGLQASQTFASNELQQPLAPVTSQPAQQPPPSITQLPFENTTSTTDNDPFIIPQAPSTAFDQDESARNLKIRDQPIQEDAGEAQLAMNNMANQLRLQAQNSSMKRTTGSVRGRRDVRNTMFIPGNQEIPGLSQFANGALPPASGSSASAVNATIPPSNQPPLFGSSLDATPVKRTGTGATTLDDHTASLDSSSIHSSQSLATMTHHPELQEPGLNASIVETVSTWFSETGITKSFVVGEIAFAHINVPNSTPLEQEAVRLQNFQILEKVAANPTFVTAFKSVTATAEEQAGTYMVALPAIRRSIPTVGLKYQLHLDDTTLANYSPALITPAWQIVQGQASVIVMYSLNPAFKAHASISGTEITLKNVAISVNLDIKDASSGKPTSAMMAPTQGASFRRKAGAVIWRFPELKVREQQERLLVRFIVEGELARKGGIEVKFELPNATVSNLGVEKSASGGLDGTASAAVSDPFADTDASAASAWAAIPTKKMTVSGKYTAA